MAVSQLAAPAVSDALAGDFLSTGDTNEAVVTPAGYAFSIWSVITLLSAITIAAVVRNGLGAPWETGLLIDASIVFIGFSAWLVAAANNWLWVSVGVFALMVAALTDVMRLLVRHDDDMTCPLWLRTLVTITFGLYLGWSSVAVFVNVAAALISIGWSPIETHWQAGILMAATIAAIAYCAVLRASAGYVAAALWALLAVAVGTAHRGALDLAVLAVMGSVAVLATAFVIVRRLSPQL
jgi:hypothetical protein